MKLPCEIPVFQEFIDAGQCNDPKKCAISLAVQDYFEGKFSVEVHPDWVIIDHEAYKTTRDLRGWINYFDKAKDEVRPITVELYEDEDDGVKCAEVLWADEAEEYENE